MAAVAAAGRAAAARGVRALGALRWSGVARGAAAGAGGGPPQELNPETVSYLIDRSGAREVYLVGTAHVSEASARDVRHTISIARPHTVMVELCPGRAQRLRSGDRGASPQDVARQIVEQLARGGGARPGFGVEALLKLGFASLYALLRQYGLVSGIEFRAALEEADSLGLPVCCGDRAVDETLARLRVALSQLSLARLASAPPPPAELAAALTGGSGPWSIGASVEELKNRRQIAALRRYAGEVVPEVMDVMVSERDALMTDKLLSECKVGRTVAVVGMAHMDGIESEWRLRGGDVFIHAGNSLRTGA